MMGAMRERIDQLAPRERLVLLAGGLVVILLLLYVMVWQPLSRNHARLTGEVAEYGSELEWMRSAAMEARLLESGSQEAVADSRSLIARVTAELRADQIRAERVQPEGDDRLRLGLERVAFTGLLAPLERMQAKYGIRVVEAAIEPVPDSPGLVNARMLLQRNGK